jgi:replication factor A1
MTQGNNASFETLSKGRGVDGMNGGGGGGRVQERKVLTQITEEGLGLKETPDYLSCRATVTLLRNDTNKPPWYMACQTCNKKVTDTGDGNWHCEKCNTSGVIAVPRYILSAMIADSTGAQWVSLFNEQAEVVLNKKATELAEYLVNDPTAFTQAFKERQFKQFSWRIRAKAELQQDERRLRCNVVECSPLNYLKETELLLAEISKYNV